MYLLLFHAKLSDIIDFTKHLAAYFFLLQCRRSLLAVQLGLQLVGAPLDVAIGVREVALCDVNGLVDGAPRVFQ